MHTCKPYKVSYRRDDDIWIRRGTLKNYWSISCFYDAEKPSTQKWM